MTASEIHRMRVALLLIIGIALGTLGGIYFVNALHQRNPVPRAVMVMMQYHFGQLEHQMRSGTCSAAARAPQLAQLALDASNIAPVFNGLDATFARFANQLQQRIAQAASSPETDCATLRKQLRRIQQNCDACHRQYR